MKKSNPSLPFLKGGINLLDLSRLVYEDDLEFAEKMDIQDPLSKFKEYFNFPKNEEGNDLIYFCGNSLGLQSKRAEQEVEKVLVQWKNLGVKGHFNGEQPWVPFHLSLKEGMAKIVGAKPAEVTIMNTLSVNLHLMLASFYNPSGKRTKILVEKDIFPSDRYAVESQIEWHGLSKEEHIMYLPVFSDGLIKNKDIAKILEEKGEEIALVLLGGVNYYTGQALDIKEITKLAHEKGCKVGFDLAHAAGNVELNLNNNGVDFAVWCTYKYLNAGPGSIAGVFVHEKHHDSQEIPKLKGWWGHNTEIRFGMREEFDPMPGVESWQISCQPMLSLAPVKASIEIFNEAGMNALRNKSVLLTGYLEYLIRETGNENIRIITPNIQSERGCQLSIEIVEGDKSIYQELMKRGVVVDWRNPNVIRVAPAPLFNGYTEVWRFVEILKSII